MPRRLSKADYVGLILGFSLLATVVLAQVAQDREKSNRARCQANLGLLAKASLVYAADNIDSLPCYPPLTAVTYDAAIKADIGKDGAEETIEWIYKEKKYTSNPSSNLWILVLQGSMPTKYLLCPSDPFANKTADITKGMSYYTNFQDAKNISYSSAFPWAGGDDAHPKFGGVWRNQTDASKALYSDMAPYLGQKAKPGEAATRPANSQKEDPVDPQWAVTKANSQNHQFEGQNVAFDDGHADWTKNPDVGQNNDSIWGIIKEEGKVRKSANENVIEIPIEAGKLPHAPSGVPGAYDVVMVPTRDAKGELK